MDESLWEKMDLRERVLCELPVHLQESNKYKHRITIQYRLLQTVETVAGIGRRVLIGWGGQGDRIIGDGYGPLYLS